MIASPLALIRWLQNQNQHKLYEVKQLKNKRSLNANGYAWALINEIANVTRVPNMEVYEVMLQRYGQVSLIELRSDVPAHEYFKHYRALEAEEVNGDVYITYLIFKGTSQYNSYEMSVFIDGLVYEAEQLDIPTLSNLEIERMIHDEKER